MRKLFIISLFLILVLADSHKYKHNRSSAAHKVVKWLIISVIGAIGFFAFRFIVRRRRLMRKMTRQQQHKNLRNTVVQGEPMTPTSESPQFYAVPIEQYQQFQAWQQQQKQQQEWLIQQQQQQLYYQQQQQQSIQQQQQIQQQLLQQPVQQQEQSQYYQQGTPLYPQLNLSQVQMPNIRVGQ